MMIRLLRRQLPVMAAVMVSVMMLVGTVCWVQPPVALAKLELKKTEQRLGFSKTKEGLEYKDVKTGDGQVVAAGDRVRVHYTGMFMDGEVFDSSVLRGKPFEFNLGAHEVIPGWDLGLEGMQVGGKRTLVVPPELGYGPKGHPPVIPPNATLKFDVELLDVVEE